MKRETDETDISEEELRRHWLAMITPPSEAEGETTWVENEPLSREREEGLLDAIRSRKAQNSGDKRLTDAEYLFKIIHKDENEKTPDHSEKVIHEEEDILPVKEASVYDRSSEQHDLAAKNKDFFRSAGRMTDQENKDIKKEEEKVISFKKYFLPLGMAAALALAFFPLFQNKQQVQYAGVEFGSWADSRQMRGVDKEEVGNSLPEWVTMVSYSDQNAREAWLKEKVGENNKIKVWIDEDKGKILIQKPDMEDTEEITLDPEQSVLDQLLKILKDLKDELSTQ